MAFLSTHPVRGATIVSNNKGWCMDISIHAPREGCDSLSLYSAATLWISIHAPREGCDLYTYSALALLTISIHAPREGCDIKRF